jgi:hypothetical protein
MKKIWMIAAVACAALMVACSSPEDKAKDFAKQMKEAGDDKAKIEKIKAEADKYYEGLDKEDKEKFDKAFAEATK